MLVLYRVLKCLAIHPPKRRIKKAEAGLSGFSFMNTNAQRTPHLSPHAGVQLLEHKFG
jgi:hypothetical protein